jgi:V/A-type H+-transporting ATPase subunit I
MSVLKMKFISIVGKKDYFDDFVYNYIIDSSIQLENAINFLENIKGLSPYSSENPYYDMVTRSMSLMDSMNLDKSVVVDVEDLKSYFSSVDEIRMELSNLEQQFQNYQSRREQIKDELNKLNHMEKQLDLLLDLEVDIDSFFTFEFIKFRFGKMPKKTYKQLKLYMDNMEVIVVPVSRDEEYQWLIYFTPRKYFEKVDGVFSSFYFERVRISDQLKGTPSEALRQLNEKRNALIAEQKALDETIKNFIGSNREKVTALYYSSVRINRISEVRKYASHTFESFYIIGWMPEEDLNKITPILDKDERIVYVHEEPELMRTIQPPTELKNHRIFRPFETLVRMYGLPAYNEIDPTAFVGITYFIMFGMMFGDIGQGLVLFAGGILLMKLRVALGGVILGAGLSSFIFGFFYGSIFGFEDWIEPLFIRPMENINTMLIIGVLTGVLLITVSMALNITNGIKSRNLSRIFFDRNGIAGFIFYWSVLLTALSLFQGNKPFLPAGVIALVIIISVAAMFFKEPMDRILRKKKAFTSGSRDFFVEAFSELFDTVLSFASNTISFIRLSAFALNHAGLFMAVLILAEMAKGFGSVVAIIIGNILIIGLEGLIVGIQGLRLEYYELFSRFFTGGGKPYRPLKKLYYS